MTDMTSGSDTREARTLDDPVMGWALDQEAGLLRREPGYRDFGRSSKTLGKGPHVRLVLTAARSGVELGNELTDAATAMHVVSGEIAVDAAGRQVRFGAGNVVWFAEGDGWTVRVEADAVLVLSIGWPGGDEAEDLQRG